MREALFFTHDNNMGNLKLTDLIDPEVLQEIQDGFASVTGMAALTTDEHGNPVTSGSNFTDFCMKYTRQSKEGCKRCERCDKQGGEETQRTGKASAYVCHAGLMDFAAPIMLDGAFIGSFIGGQVLIDKPDDAEFTRIAGELEIDKDEYIEAVHKVQIVPRERVEAAAAFLQTISKVLSSMAFNSLNTNQINADLIESIDMTSSKCAKWQNGTSVQCSKSKRSLRSSATLPRNASPPSIVLPRPSMSFRTTPPPPTS